MKTLIFIFAFGMTMLKAQVGTILIYNTNGTNTLSSANNIYTLNCFTPQLSMYALCSTSALTTYTWVSGITYATGSAATLNIPGNYTVFAQYGTSIVTQTLSVYINTTIPISSASSTFQVVTGTASSQAFTFTAISPTVNTMHIVYNPWGGIFYSPTNTIIYMSNGPGTYTHCIQDDENGCLSCHPFIVSLGASGTVNLKEEQNSVQSIYPNPSNGLFTLELRSGTQNKIEVYNSLGAMLRTLYPEKDKAIINMQEEARGVYFIKVWSNEGSPRTLKVILE